jgi:hypothetical protein
VRALCGIQICSGAPLFFIFHKGRSILQIAIEAHILTYFIFLLTHLCTYSLFSLFPLLQLATALNVCSCFF